MLRLKFFTPFRVVILFIALIAVGFATLPLLSINLLPVAESKNLEVSLVMPEASPDIIEQQVVSVVEGGLSQIAGVKHIRSTSLYNSGFVNVEFDKDADMKARQLEVSALLRRIYRQLPANTSYSVARRGQRSNRNQSAFLTYTVNAPQQPGEVKRKVEDLFKKEFAALAGIDRISVTGASGFQVTVLYNKAKAEAWGIRPDDLIRSLGTYGNASYPGSFRNTDGQELTLRIPSEQARLADIGDVIVKNEHGEAFHVRDVATVFQQEKEISGYYRVNGHNSITVSFFAHDDVNQIKLAEDIKKIVSQVSRRLPVGYEVRIAYDDTSFLKTELEKNTRRAALSCAILLLFLLIAYRNYRQVVVLVSGLIATLSFTSIFIYLTGLSIHLYTIAGLAMAFGMIVDNKIVMLDYYRQFRSVSVIKAMLASTLIIISALSLVFFLPEEERGYLSQFALVISLALASSMIVSLFFVPGVSALLPAMQQTAGEGRTFSLLKNTHYYKLIAFIARYRKLFSLTLILVFGLPLFLLPSQWEGDSFLHRIYNASVGSETYQKEFKPVVNKWLGGTLTRFVNAASDHGGYRDPSRTRLFVFAELPYGNTMEQLNVILRQMERYLAGIKGVDEYITTITSGQRGAIEIRFQKEVEDGNLPFQVKARLMSWSMDWGGVEWDIYGVGQGFNTSITEEIPRFRVLLKGYNYDELERVAKKLGTELTDHPRIQKVNINDKSEFNEKESQEFVLTIDQQQLAVSGASNAEVYAALNASGAAIVLQERITVDNNYYRLVLKEQGTDSFSKHALLNESLLIDSARRITLSNIADLTLQPTASVIRKEDRQYIRIVSFQYMGNAQFGGAYLDSLLTPFNQHIPVGYSARRDHAAWEFDDAGQQYLLVFLLLLCIYTICSILFENLKMPLYIISVIGISFIGLFTTFVWGDYYFDQGGFAAFILLGGLVASAGIYIGNDFSALKKANPSADPNQLLIHAIRNRSRTIILNTLSASCGLIPFLLEGQREVFWFSFAAGTLGGLACSLPAVFIALPVFYWKKREDSKFKSKN